MKTVKGEVLSTTPISLSKATSILSKFVSAGTGSSQAICAYLRRASASFDELNQLHKELKSHRKCKTPNSDTVTEDGERSRSFTSDLHDGGVSERKKRKKKKEEEERGLFGKIVKSEGAIVEDRVKKEIEASDFGVEDEKKNYKKKRGEVLKLEEAKGELKIEEDSNVGIDDNDRKNHRKYKGENVVKFGYLEEDKKIVNVKDDEDTGMDKQIKKHKKKRETSVYQFDDLKVNGHKIVVKEHEPEKKKKKKRKIEEIEEGKEINSEESRKKKKRKGEGDS